MTNMSYCRFQNTRRDLYDCVTALKEEGLPESEDELEAFHSMVRTCKRFVELANELTEGGDYD